MDTPVVDLTVQAGPLSLKNPVLAASGTVGYGEEMRDCLDWSQVGGIVGKTITLKPRKGNPPPRTAETASGLLNSIGLQNEGIQSFLAGTLPRMRTLGTAVIVNIGGADVEEFCALTDLLEKEEGIAALELNISCPNVAEGGMFLDRDPKQIRLLLETLRPRTGLPLIVKLTPNVSDIVVVAKAAIDGGGDILSVANTYYGLALDWRSQRPLVGGGTGGVSGPAIKPITLRHVHEVTSKLGAPVMGVGGVMTAQDALEYLVAGAACVQVGTANFIDPTVCSRIADEMERLLAEAGVADVKDLIGTLQMPSRE